MRGSRVEFDPAPSNASHRLVGPSYTRKAIIFFPAQGEVVTLSNDFPVVLHKGITLQQSGPPIRLSVEEHGDCVCRDWYAIGSLGTNPVSFIQVIE